MLPVTALAAAALLVAFLVALRLRGKVRDRDVAWLAGTRAVDPDVRAVYVAHLTRHREARFWGGLVGVLLAVLVGFTWNQGTFTLGTGSGAPLNDVLFCGVTGVLAGTLGAETHRLGRPRGPAAASLAPRAPTARSGAVAVGRILAAVALALGVGASAADSRASHLVVTCALLVPFGLAEAVRRSVIDRRRPAMSVRATRVDSRLRLFATTTAGRLGLAASLAATNGAVVRYDHPATTIIGLVALVAAVVVLWHAAPRPRGGRALHPADEPLGAAPPPPDGEREEHAGAVA